MNTWIWIAIGAVGVLIFVIWSVVMYHKGKKKGQTLVYADPMRRKDDDESTRRYLTALRPFIPERLLSCLNIREGILAGEELVEQRADVTAAFLCGGRSTLSKNESVTSDADAVFDGLNRMFSVVVPAVTEYDGAVESVQDGVFRSLFFDRPESALRAAVTVSDETDNGYLSLGLSYGIFSVGIVGYADRMEITSISTYTHVGEFLRESANKLYATILATGEFVKHIPDYDKKFNSRLLGKIHYSGMDDSDEIYDVFEGDQVDQRNKKRKTKMLFEKGVRLFWDKEFAEARGYFVEVLKADHDDSAARHYLFLCDTYQKRTEDNQDEVDIYLLRV